MVRFYTLQIMSARTRTAHRDPCERLVIDFFKQIIRFKKFDNLPISVSMDDFPPINYFRSE